MTFAVQVGAIERSPVKDIDQLTEKKAKYKKKIPRALTAEQVIDLLSKLDSDPKAVAHNLPDIVRLFLATGERRGEALGALWQDFDAENKELAMTGNIIQVRGIGLVRNEGKS